MAIAFDAMLAVCLTALVKGNSADRSATQVSRAGNFELPCSADAAFPLFSPEGERHWVKGWDPKPVFPDLIEFSRDTVFRTGSSGEEAVWTILDADWQNRRAEYVRVAPTSHAARIKVEVRPSAEERCMVTVSYTVTSFGERMDSLLSEFSSEAYAGKMRDWQQRISEYLQSRTAKEQEA